MALDLCVQSFLYGNNLMRQSSDRIYYVHFFQWKIPNVPIFKKVPLHRKDYILAYKVLCYKEDIFFIFEGLIEFDDSRMI